MTGLQEAQHGISHGETYSGDESSMCMEEDYLDDDDDDATDNRI